MTLKVALAVLFFSLTAALSAQTDSTAKWQLHLAPSFSFSGFNTELGLERSNGDHRYGAGYKVLLSESAFFNQLEHGMYAYYSRQLTERGRWSAGLHARVIQTFRQSGGRTGEYLIGQELRLAIGKRVHLSQILAIGMYEETLISDRYNFSTWGYGADGLLLIGMEYRLGR